MQKFKKVLLGGFSATLALSAPIAVAVSCGDWAGKFELRLNGETNEELSDKLAFVTDGGSADDKSFNEQGYDAYHALSGHTKESVLRPDGGTSFEIKKRYETAAKYGSRVIIAPGFHHVSAIESFNKSFGEKKVGFILVDGEMKYKDGKDKDKGISNVASIVFETKYSGFLAGYLAAEYLTEIKKDETPKVGMFGGANFPGVTNFMVGFISGIHYYNNFKKPTHEVEFSKFASDEEYTNSGFSAGQGTPYANKLLQNGADIILPVAGPQTGDVISAINQNQKYSDVKIIGVDTDQALQYENNQNKFLTSIEKKLSLAIQKVWKKAIDPKNHQDATYDGVNGFGETTVGTLKNELTSISKPHVSGVEDIYNKVVNDATLKTKAVEITEKMDWNAALSILKQMY
ncbi:BMP family ABC transporter substrate-binding protein [Mycoplasma todarodis]|uniref:BMP family ABC transporter substrate-binding protein n=1 Tax=Mycoplasma todarodis TaxID=1937191 RepID=UPI003B2FF45E